MKFDKKKITILATGILLGSVAGYLYWRFVGCESGSCGITANWHTSTLMGGLFGYLITDSFPLKKKHKTPLEQE
jgi:hypothetical protein